MSQLEKVIRILEQTDEAAVVLDSQGEPKYALLPINKYLKLVENKVGALEQGVKNVEKSAVEPSGSMAEKQLNEAENSQDNRKYFFEPID